ncbi:MAG: exopolysaccharide Pel transporter PelG [Candidatus Saccharibacteria bacterium]|nr:exopolysaccharide Pel transporter PelG [Pseudorhodobacter sp.]
MTVGPLARLDWLLDGALLAPIRRSLSAFVVAAGPWMVAVGAIAFASWTVEPVIGPQAAEDFRLAVIYAFALAPLASAPISTVAARRISAGLVPQAQVAGLFIVAAGLSGLAAQALALLVALVLGLRDAEIAVALVFLTGAAAVMWTGFAMMTALRQFRFLIASFSIGIALAILLFVGLRHSSLTVAALIWFFTFGVTACAGLIGLRLQVWQARSDFGLDGAARMLRDESGRSFPLAVGAVLGILGVWIDKWVFWFSPSGLVSTAGFANFPDYDSAMFLAHMSVIPSLAALMAFHDGDLRQAMLRFRAVLAGGRTLTAVRQAVAQVAFVVRGGLFMILLTQLAITSALILFAPVLAQLLGMRLDQYLTLRTGLAGAFMHVAFLAANGILLLCNRQWAFLGLQALFLGLNLSLSLVFILGYGTTANAFLGSSAICAVIAMASAFAAVQKLDYLHLLAENDGLYHPAR